MFIQIFLFLSVAQAAPNYSCDKISSYKEFYFCTLSKHPRFEVSKLKVIEGEAIVDKASQWQNPDLTAKSITGTNAGENVGSTEVGLSVSISQLWVRGAVKDIARAEKKLTDIESKESLLGIQKDLIKDLYRLRQIDVELELISETIATFDKIKGQYKGRLARGAEQEITLNLVELATSDYELKKNHLAIEKASIISELKAIWGNDFQVKKEFLPPLKEKWPEVQTTANLAPSFEAQKVKAEFEKAQAEESLANRESWPSLSVGPVMERNTQGPTQFIQYGVNATLSLPILSWNGGGRKLAEVRALQTKLLAESANKKFQTEKEILLNKYKSSVESLKKSSNQKDINKKHSSVDGLFKRGLASGTLVIEAHRQITEYTESQHEHENSAIESYLEIKALSGESIEEIF